MITYIKYNKDLYRIKFTLLLTGVRKYCNGIGWCPSNMTFPVYDKDFLMEYRIEPEQVKKEIQKIDMMKSLAK